MAVLTPEQREALRRVLRDASRAIAVSTFGYSPDPDELQRLTDLGYLTAKQGLDLARAAFSQGTLDGAEHRRSAFLGAADHPSRQLSFDDLLRRTAAEEIPLSDAERAAREHAAQRAGEYCVGLGNRWDDGLQRVIADADHEFQQQRRETIADETASAIVGRESRGQLRSNLRQATEDWTRDWERIANTEMQTAHEEGVYEAAVTRDGNETLLCKVPDPGACDRCRALYLGSDGRPIVRSASWWGAQGTNVGRKQAEWKPTIGTVHPHCLLPGSMVLTRRGNVRAEEVKVGDLVLTHRGRYRPVTEVSSRWYSGAVVELDRLLTVTADHPLAFACGHWNRADGIRKGTHLVQISSHARLADLDAKECPASSAKKPVLESILLLLSGSGVPIAAVNFDGDLSIRKAQIDQVSTNNDVVQRIDADLLKSLGYTLLEIGEGPTFIVSPQPASNLFLRSNPPPGSLVSGAGEPLTLILGRAVHAELQRFRTRALRKTGLVHSGDQGLAADPKSGSYLLYSQTLREVESHNFFNWHRLDFSHNLFIPRQIANVDTREWAGYVFNLAVLEDESYVVDGFLSHNCRCELLRVPGGWTVTEDGELEPPKAEGEEKASPAATLEKALKHSGSAQGAHDKLSGHFAGDWDPKTDPRGVQSPHRIGSNRKPSHVSEVAQIAKSHKLHYKTMYAGIPISVENRKGTYRRWHDPNSGQEGLTLMQMAYGYICLPQADHVDGDKIDVFLGPNQDAPMVYVVHQLKAPEFKAYDEDKVILGVESRSEAERAYLAHYDTPDFFGWIDEIPIETFRRNLLAGRYRGKRIEKGEVLEGIAYSGPQNLGSVGSGAFLTDPRPRVERLIDLTSLMEWMKEYVALQRKTKRRRLIVDPAALLPPIRKPLAQPNPPPRENPMVDDLSDLRRDVIEAAEQRRAAQKEALTESAIAARDLQRWTP